MPIFTQYVGTKTERFIGIIRKKNKWFIDEKKAQLTEKNSAGCALTLFKYINPFIVVFSLYVFLNIIFAKHINYFIKTFGKIQSF